MAVADNDGVGLLLQENQDKSNTYATDLADDDSEKSRLRKLLATKSGLEDAKAIAFYSNVLTKNGEITAGDWQSKVITEGKVGHFTLGFAISSNSDKHVEKKAHNRSLYTAIKDWIKSKRSSREQAHAPWEEMEWDNDLNQEMQELNGLGINNEEVNQDARQNVLNEDGDEQAVAQQNNSPKISFSGAGAIGVMKVDVVSASMMEGTTLNITKAAGKVQNLTNDDSLLVLMAGGTASAATGSAQNNSGGDKSIALSGAGSVIFGQSTLSAILSNTNINGAKEIYNSAVRDGVLGNAAAAVSVSRGTNNGLDLSSASGATVSLMKYDTKALLSGNSVNNSVEESAFPTNFCVTDITNTALDQDLQIMGGLDVAVAKGGNKAIGIGAVVTLAKVDNDVIALMDNGGLAGNSVYQKVGNVDVVAATDITQISAAIGAGIAASSGQNSAGVVFQGNVVYNQLDNDAKAEVNAITMTGESLNVAAYDTNLTKADLSSKNEENKNSLVVYGFDVDGKTYISHVQEQIEGENGTANTDLQDNGNLIVSGALEIAASTGSGIGASIGAGVIVGDIDNDFISIVKDSVISLGSGMMVSESNYVYPAQVFAESNTLQVGVAAGGNGSESGFAGGGSVVVNLFENDVIAKVDGSVFNTIGLRVDAQNKQKLVNVAGQIDIGKNAIGLDMVYNYMLNNTGAYFTNSSIANVTVVEGQNIYGVTNLVLDANNDSDVYAIALGVSANTNVDSFIAANGSVAVNRGQNNVEAVAEKNALGKKDLVGLKTFTVHSKDDSYMAAATGGLTLSIGTTAFGGALTWNRLGSLTVDSTTGKIGKDDTKKQVNKAIVSGYDVHMADNGVLTVKAEDVADFVTVAIGLGIGGVGSKFTLQGANANAYINKETTASIIGGNINQDDATYQDASHFADVNVNASTDNEFDTVSVVLATSGQVAIGAALAQNTMMGDTKANVTAGTDNSSYLAKDMLIKATSDMDLLNVDVGVAASGLVSVGGSVVDNIIDNDTIAELGGTGGGVTNVISRGSVGVISESKEKFANYSGQANVTIGGVAGGGMALAINEIKGDTIAKAQNADIQTMNITGKKISLKDSINDKTLSLSGLVVGTDAWHDFYNAPFCGGLTANAGEFALGIDATISVNNISGSTKAEVEATEFNKIATSGLASGNDFTVQATDKMDSESVVTNAVLSIAANIGVAAAVGASVNTETNSRTVRAAVEENDTRYRINADKMAVRADSFAKLTAVNTAVSVAGSVGASGALTTGVTYADLEETTEAIVKGVTSYNNGLSIVANHKDEMTLVGTGVTLAVSPDLFSAGVTIGVAVSAENNTATTEAKLDSSKIYHYTDGVAEDVIKATSDSYTLTQTANVAATISLYSAAVGVLVADNDLRQTVKASAVDSTIGTAEKRAKSISVLSDNKVEGGFYNENVAGALMAGIGVGVGLNTVDTSVSANANNINFFAKEDIAVKATETITLNGAMAAVNAGIVSVGVSTLHNYISTAVVPDDYSTWDEQHKDEKDPSKAKVSSTDMANGEFSAAKIEGLKGNAIDTGNANLNEIRTKKKTAAQGTMTKVTRIGRTSNTGDKVNLNNANLTAGGNIDIQAKETANTYTRLGGGSVGLASIQVEVNRQKFTGNVGANITGGVWKAGKNISIDASLDGKLRNLTVQVGIGLAAVGVTIGELLKEPGGTAITLNTAKMTANSISLNSKDSLALENKGVSASVGIVTATAVDFTAKDKASSTITLEYDNVAKKANDLEAGAISIGCYSVPNVYSDFTAVAVALVSGSGVVMESTANNSTNITLEKGNRLWADTVNIDSAVYNLENQYSVYTDVLGVFASAASVIVNKARTYSDINASADVGPVTLKTEEETDSDGKKKTVGKSDVHITARDATNAKNKVKGITVGLIVAVGSNYSQSDLKSTVKTKVDGGTDGLYANNLTIDANSNDKIDSLAYGDGGGIVGISPVAACVEAKVTGVTTTELTGVFNVASELKGGSLRQDDLQYVADAHQSEILGGSGVQVEVEGTENTTTNLREAVINSGGINLDSKTIVNLNKSDDVMTSSYDEKERIVAVLGNGMGCLGDLTKVKFENTWEITNKVDVIGGKIVSQKDLNLGASTEGYIVGVTSVDSFGLIYNGAYSTTKNNITVNDSVTVCDNAELRTEKVDADVNLAASDSWLMDLVGIASCGTGFVGCAVPKLYNTLNRNNTIDIANGKVFSIRDINLSAEKKTNGTVGNMELALSALAYNDAFVEGDAIPTLSNTVNQKNVIKVQESGSVQGTRHVNLYADAGRETIIKVSKGFSEEADVKYVSTTQGNINVAVNRNNSVEVNGSVVAGVANLLDITIGSLSNNLVFLTEADRQSVAAANPGATVYGKNDKDTFISLGSEDSQTAAQIAGITKDKFILDQEPYKDSLKKRLSELNTLMAEYSKEGDTAVYIGLKAEAERIQQLIATANLDMDHDNIDYIELPNLVASGGNVNVNTKNFIGDGTVEAKGSPSITIKNYTNLTMKVNNVTVDDPGGVIYYNGNTLDPASGTGTVSENLKSQVNKINSGKTITGTMTAAKGTSASVVIEGAYDGKDVKYSGTIDDKVVTGSFTPRADVVINGNINSLKGSVSIDSANNNITIEGKTASDAVAVNGKVLRITAVKGSITQGFTNGIVNIGGDVKSLYESSYNSFIKQNENVFTEKPVEPVLKSQSFFDKMEYDLEMTKYRIALLQWEKTQKTVVKSYDLIKTELKDGQKAPEVAKESDGNVTGNWIAGGQVFINAADININGVIQSGFDHYYVDTQKDATEIIARKTGVDINWIVNGSKVLDDKEVYGNNLYRVVDGGAYWNATKGCYEYKLNLYYNPSTKKLLTEDVDASGGKIYLTGRIASTGNGKIICLDGAYNIDVNNTLNYDLQVGKLLVNDTKGLVTITDSLSGCITEITAADGAVTKNLKTQEIVTNTQITGSGRNYTYKPTSGLRYNWVEGYENTSNTTYQKTEKAGWWGLADFKSVGTETLDSWSSDARAISSPVVSADTDRPTGVYVTTENNESMSAKGVVYTHSGKVSTDEKYTFVNSWTEQDGWWIFKSPNIYRYTQFKKEHGNNFYDYASVKADNPISITFIGTTAEKSAVTVNTTKDLLITGKIGNSQLYEIKNGDSVTYQEKGGVNLTSATGSVIQQGNTLYGATINLSAAKNLENINITAGDMVNLTGIFGNTGAVTVEAAYGGAQGNVILNNFGSNGATEAMLKSTGYIHQASDANIVQAKRIDLVSVNGDIAGYNNGFLRLQGGQNIDADGTDSLKASVSAQANGKVKLGQITGDLRVGKIYSMTDDLEIVVTDGGIVDALPYDTSTDKVSDERMLSLWRSLGIVKNADGSKSNGWKEKEAAQKAASEAYATHTKQVENEYSIFIDLQAKKTSYETNLAKYKTEFERYTDLVAKAEKTSDEQAELQTLAKYKSFGSGESYYKNTKPEEVFSAQDQSNLTAFETKFAGCSSAADFLAKDQQSQELYTATKDTPAEYKGWNADQLLYAIQDSVINPSTAFTTSSKEANLFGKNVTLIVNNGVGLNSDEVKVVDLTTLGQMDAKGNLVHLDDLKALATADASTVDWNATTNKATISKRLAIGLQQEGSGTITVIKATNAQSSQDNIYVESRKLAETVLAEARQNYDLNLNSLITLSGNVTVKAWGSILNGNEYDMPAICGKDLLLQAGAKNMAAGDIGTAEKPFAIQIEGALTATATGNINLEGWGNMDLKIDSVSAGAEGGTYSATAGNITIEAQKNILSINKDGNIQGYIRSYTNGAVNLTSTEGSIGTKDHAVRILNAGLTDAEANDFSGDSKNKGSIVLSAGKDIHVEGVSTATPVKRMDDSTPPQPVKENGKDVYDQEPNGYFKLQSLAAGGDKISVTVNGNLVYGGSSWDYSAKDLSIAVAESFDTTKDMKAKNLTITTGNNIQFGAGVEVEASESVILSAGFAPGITYGPKIKLNAEGGLVSQSEGTSDNITGIKTPTLIVKATTGITLDQHNEITNVVLQNVQNNVAFTNYSDGIDMLNIAVMHTNTDLFSFDANNVGSYILGDLTIENNAKSTGDKSGIMSIWYGIAAHGNINIDNDNGMIVNVYDVVSRNGDISMFGSSLLNEGNISAANGGVVLMTSDSLQNLKSSVRNKEDYKIYGKAGVMVFANGDVTNEANITTDNGNIIVRGMGEVGAQNNFGKMTNTGDMLVTNEGDVLFYAGEGVENSGSIVVNDGDVNIRSAKHLNNTGDIATADGIVEIEARENVDNLGHLVSKKNTDNDAVAVKIKSEKGYVSNFGDIYSHDKGNVIIDAKANVDNAGCIVAKNGAVSITAGANLNNYGVQALITDIDGIYGTNGVTISANGDVYNGADIYAAEGDINIVGIGYSNTNQSTTGKVVNEGNIYVLNSGNVTFRSNKTVTNTGDIYSLGGGTVELNADGDLDNHGDIFTYDRNNPGTSTAGVSLVSVNGNVINTDDFIVEESVLLKHVLSVPQGVINAQGNILLSASQGEIRNNKALVATGDITIKSLKSIYIEDAAFKNDVNLQTTLGKTFVKGIQAGGKVTIESTNIYNSMEVTAGKGIELKATAEKDVSNGNAAIAETGVVVIKGNNGKFITESGDITITADGYTVQDNYKNALLENPVDEKFSIRNLGNNDLITKDGNVHLEGVYSVENVGNIKASTTEEPSVSPKTRGKVYLKATKGTIYNYETSSSSELLFEHVARTAAEMAAGTYFTTEKTSNSATAPHSIIADGDINWLAENIYNVAGQYSSSNLDMEITGASLYNTEKIITTGNVIVKATDQNSNVVFGSSITSETGSVTFNVGGNLTFTGGASIDAAKDIILEVGNNIISAIKLDAGENVDVHSRGGTITLNDGANSDTGLVRVYSQISTGTNGTDTVHVFGSVTAPEGSIDISSDTGDVGVDNLIAKNLAGVGTMKGDIKINGTISGKKVSIYTEDKDAKFTVNEMKATDELIVAGNYFNDSPYLDMSKFMGDNDGFKLHIFGVGGADPSNSRGNYILDYTNVGCNVEIGTVSVDTVKIITETPVKIDHLNVGNRADITCMGVTSSVYGRAHQYDVGSKVIYYAPGDPGAGINLHPVYFDEPLPKQPYIDQLMEDSTQFMNGAGAVQQGPLSVGNGPTVSSVHKNGGMSLNIMTPLNQRGTGILLKNFYGQKTFAQRFSAENLEQHLNSEKAQDFYNGYFNMGVEFFETYNLLDIPSANLNQGQGQRTSNVIQLETMFEDGGVVVEGITTDNDGKKVKKSVEYEF